MIRSLRSGAKDPLIRPFWLSSLSVFFIKRILFRRKLPLLASIKLTYRCNLACRACPFHHRAEREPLSMTWKTARDTLHLLKARGCRIVVFEGGEPFLWHDGETGLADLVTEAKTLFWRVAVTTNGTFPLTVPADVLWVSLDGLKQTHDRLRSNSFDRVWHHLSTAAHPNVLVHFTLNKENWRELEMTVEQVAELPGIRGITLQLFYPYDQGEEPLRLSLSERKAALDAAVKLKNAGYPIFNSQRQLRAMVANDWVCRDDLLINVDPDGEVTQGCYVKNRGQVKCTDCGFTPCAEASGALSLQPGSIIAGWKTFVLKK